MKVTLSVEDSLEFAQMNARLEGFVLGAQSLAQHIREQWVKDRLAKQNCGNSPNPVSSAQETQNGTAAQHEPPIPSDAGNAAPRNGDARGASRAGWDASAENGHDGRAANGSAMVAESGAGA